MAAAAAVAAVSALPGAAFAQMTDAAWTFRLGGFFPKVDTQVRADGSNGLRGTTIDFESDLGLDDSKTLPMVEMGWRIAPNHRLELGYLDLSRDATSTLRTTITFRDQVYTVNSNVRGQFDSTIFALTYLYSFYHTPETELAAGIGLFTTKLKASISSVGTSLSTNREVDATAPLPVIALRATQHFSPSWYGELRYQWFGIKIQEYDGSLNVVNATVGWFPWRNVGFEAGYSFNKYDIKVAKDSWNGQAKYEFSGPTIAVVASF